jgi:hypothetical protein
VANRLSFLPAPSGRGAEALDARRSFTTMTDLGTSTWKRSQVGLIVSIEEGGGLITEFGSVSRSWAPLANGWHKLTYRQVDTIEPLGVGELVQALPPRHRDGTARAIDKGGILTPTVSKAVVEAFERLRPESAPELQRLINEEPGLAVTLSGPGLQIAAQEVDAVVTALEMAGMPKAALGSTRADGVLSFVERLSELRMREDPAINYDAGQFLDFDRISHPAGIVEFTHNGERLTVINVNRQPLERTTGADLIYLNETAGSVVLVQYKTFGYEGSPAKLVYRPDDQLDAELARMREIVKKRSSTALTLETFRFNPGFCYLKFCDPVTTLARQPGQLVSGFYLPVDYYDLVVSSDVTDGPRGGKMITYDNVPSQMSNETFTGLVRGGWIGTQGVTSKRLTDMVIEGLDANRSQTIAVAGK